MGWWTQGVCNGHSKQPGRHIHLLSVVSSVISYILHLYLFLSPHAHVLSSTLAHKRLSLPINGNIYCTHSKCPILACTASDHKSSLQQMLPRSYFHIPLSADTHLMDPVLFPLPVFQHTLQMTASSSLPVPLFLLCLSPCHSVIQSEKQRGFLQGREILSFRQRGSQAVELNCRWSTPELLAGWPV